MKQPGISHEPQANGPEMITNPSGEVIALRFNVLQLLESVVGPDWQEQISGVIEGGSLNLRAADGHYTNREYGNPAQFGLITADGQDLASTVPGVWGLYQTSFAEMMQQALPPGAEPLKVYSDPKLALEGYAQQPVEKAGSKEVQYRMEAHTDMRYTAVLVVKAPKHERDGGRLVISNNPNAQNVDEINKDATRIMHVPATVLCFTEGRNYPHYTEEVVSPDAKRVVVSLNYPLETETDAAAADLLRHIEGVQR
jgi:hypothetical protein